MLQFACKVTKKDSNIQIFFENYEDYTAFSRELSLVSATKLRFMGSYPDALALRSANTALVYVPMGISDNW